MAGEEDKRFTVRFRGVRGSHPTPGEHTVRFGGNTSCVEVRAGTHLIILDAGTGIISLGNDLMRAHHASGKSTADRAPITFTLLFSHKHHDHTQGFAFFKPVYLPTSTCYIYGPRLLEEELEEGLSKAMLSPYFPVELDDLNSVRHIKSLRESDMIVFETAESAPKVINYYRNNHQDVPCQVRVRLMHSLAHPNGGVFVYRIEMNGKSVVFATDTEGYVGGDQRLMKFAAGTDLLIHDSQYMAEQYAASEVPVQGYGHSTVDMAAEVASKAGAKKLALYHFDPQYDDKAITKMEERAKSIFSNSIAAHEGLELEL